MPVSRTISLAEGIRLFERFGQRAVKTVAAAGRAVVTLMARDTVKSKLQGQRLNRVTGTLIRSVTASPSVRELDAGAEATFGTKLDYGVLHEQGYQGPVTVRAHTRAMPAMVQQVPAGARYSRGQVVPYRAHVRSLPPRTQNVREHTRYANFRARWYLRDTFLEDESKIQPVVDAGLTHLWDTGEVPKWPDLVK